MNRLLLVTLLSGSCPPALPGIAGLPPEPPYDVRIVATVSQARELERQGFRISAIWLWRAAKGGAR